VSALLGGAAIGEEGGAGQSRAAQAAALEPSLPLDPLAYEAARARLEEQRQRLAAQQREATPAYGRRTAAGAAVLLEAERALAHALVAEVLPRWIGVPWRRGAASQSRRPDVEAGIHCASFVIAALEGAGLRFAHRERLAQAPALRILEAIADERGIARWRGTVPALRRELLRRGPGVYVLGLSRHIGFAVVGPALALRRAAEPDRIDAQDADARDADAHDADARDADVRVVDEVWLVHASRSAGAVVVEAMASSRALARRQGTAIFVAQLARGGEEIPQEGATADAASTGQATRLVRGAAGAPTRRWLAGTLLGPR
jgi:hypothetical protein